MTIDHNYLHGLHSATGIAADELKRAGARLLAAGIVLDNLTTQSHSNMTGEFHQLLLAAAKVSVVESGKAIDTLLGGPLFGSVHGSDARAELFKVFSGNIDALNAEIENLNELVEDDKIVDPGQSSGGDVSIDDEDGGTVLKGRAADAFVATLPPELQAVIRGLRDRLGVEEIEIHGLTGTDG